VIDGLEIRATTVAVTADLLLEVEDSDGGGGGSAIRGDDCEISTDTPRKPKCSSFETNSPFEVVFNESMIVDAEKSSDAPITTSTKSLSANASNFLRLPLELIATMITAATETSVISAIDSRNFFCSLTKRRPTEPSLKKTLNPKHQNNHIQDE
jgi:hypothetical protein